MALSRNALGRGISALIPPSSGNNRGPELVECSVERILPMEGQPRLTFDDDALAELARSVSENGILQPLVVRRDGGMFKLIAGERRLRAAKLAGLASVPAIVRESTRKEAFALALIENIQREDLAPLELAAAYRRLMDDFGLTQAEVAAEVGKSRSAVANTLRLLKLSEPSQEALRGEEISEGHARQLVGLSPTEQAEVVTEVVSGGLSVRETEARVRRRKAKETPSTEPVVRTIHAGDPGADVGSTRTTPEGSELALDERLELAIGAPVDIVEMDDGGKIVIHYRDANELRRLMTRLLSA